MLLTKVEKSHVSKYRIELAEDYQPSDILTACLTENQHANVGEKVVISDELRRISCICVIQRMVLLPDDASANAAVAAAATKAKDSSTEKDKTSQASSSSSVAAAATEPTSKDSTAGDNNNNAQSDGKSDHSNERTTPKYTFRMFILTAHYDSSVRVWSEHVDATQHNITDHPQQDKIRILQ